MEESEPETEDAKHKTGGTNIKVFWDEDNDEVGYRLPKKGKNKQQESATWSADCQDFLYGLQKKVQPWMKKLDVCTEHKRSGQIFRQHQPANRTQPE